jgi:uncharacterized protein (DUF4213/DUF364 family)
MMTKCKHSLGRRSTNLRKLSRPEINLLQRLLAAADFLGAPLDEMAMGSRFVAVRSQDRMGIASTLGAKPDSKEIKLAGKLTGGPLKDAAQLLLSPRPWLASLGLAALNAAYLPTCSADPGNLDALLPKLCAGRNVAVVGDFPFTRRLKSYAARLDLLELRSIPGAIPPSEWDSVLKSAQVAVITGTAILTGSLAGFLAKTEKATRIVVGPSTPMMPVLFGYGADLLAGCRVKEPGPVLDAVRQGLSFSQLKKAGVELLCWTTPPN